MQAGTHGCAPWNRLYFDASPKGRLADVDVRLDRARHGDWRYFQELRAHREKLEPILERVRRGHITFVFGSREERFNAAVALREFVTRRVAAGRRAAASG